MCMRAWPNGLRHHPHKVGKGGSTPPARTHFEKCLFSINYIDKISVFTIIGS